MSHESLPCALVLQWNAETFHVRCPYCWEIHQHSHEHWSLLRSERPKEMRPNAVLCNPPKVGYRLIYPWRPESGYGWEFDRQLHVFVTTNSMGRVRDQVHAQRSEHEEESALEYRMENHTVIEAKLAINQAAIFRIQPEFTTPRDENSPAWATLDRGPGYPLVIARSSPLDSPRKGFPEHIDISIWQKRAIELAKHLDCYLNEESWASHVEFQLLAYLAYHRTLESLEEARPGNKRDPLAAWQVPDKVVEGLKGFMPECNPTATITVNKPAACNSCAKLIKRFKETFPSLNVKFQFVGRTLKPQTMEQKYRALQMENLQLHEDILAMQSHLLETGADYPLAPSRIALASGSGAINISWASETPETPLEAEQTDANNDEAVGSKQTLVTRPRS